MKLGKQLLKNLMFPHSMSLHEIVAQEAFQRWPPSEMTCLQGTLVWPFSGCKNKQIALLFCATRSGEITNFTFKHILTLHTKICICMCKGTIKTQCKMKFSEKSYQSKIRMSMLENSTCRSILRNVFPFGESSFPSSFFRVVRLALFSQNIWPVLRNSA